MHPPNELFLAHSPACVEGVFSEARLTRVLRSSPCGASKKSAEPDSENTGPWAFLFDRVLRESVSYWVHPRDCKIGDVHGGDHTKGGTLDIDVIERAIKSSLETALKRMRDAESQLTKAQQGGRGEGNLKLAEALEEYNGCLAELTYYLKASSRQGDTDA